MAFVFENEQPKSRFVFEEETKGGIADTLKQQGRSALGGIEAVARTVASPLAMIPAGWAGLAKTITSGAEAGTKTIEEMSAAMNKPIMPEAEIGQEMLGRYVFEPFLEKPMKAGGEIAYEATGSPIVAAGTEAVLGTGIPMLFGGARGRGAKPIIEKPIYERAKGTERVVKEPVVEEPIIKEPVQKNHDLLLKKQDPLRK